MKFSGNIILLWQYKYVYVTLHDKTDHIVLGLNKNYKLKRSSVVIITFWHALVEEF